MFVQVSNPSGIVTFPIPKKVIIFKDEKEYHYKNGKLIKVKECK